jgi:hypothetical protein
MTINTYQIRNVLKVYGNQLKKRSNFLDGGKEPVRPSSDFVEISVEARRRQVLSQLSDRLVAQLRSQERQDRSSQEGPTGGLSSVGGGEEYALEGGNRYENR